MPSLRRFAALPFVLFAFIALVPSAFAREANFRPVIGDVLTSVSGPERVVVNEEGGFSVFSYGGDLLPNYPVHAPNAVFVTSPILADFTGSSAHEIVVVARDVAGAYTLFAYAGDGTLVASTPLPEGVYFDPIVRANGINRRDELFVATVAGNVWRVRFDPATSSFGKMLMVNLGQAAGLTLDPITRSRIYVNFPEQASVAVYRIDTGNAANAWTLDRTLPLSSPILYPVIVGDGTATTQGQSGIYGVNRANDFVGLSTTTGALLPGFPVALSATPIDAPIRNNPDPAAPNEVMVMPLANGSRVTLDFSGQIVSPLAEAPRLSGDQNIARSGAERGFISALGARGTRVINRLGNRVTSLYGRLRGTTQEQTDPDMQVVYRGAVIPSGGTLALGPAPTLTNTDFVVTVFNAGTRDLILTGAPTLAVTGADAADFQIAEYPRSLVAVKEGNRFIVRFRPRTEGVKSAVLSIPNTHSGKNPYTVTLTGSGHSSFRSLSVGSAAVQANGTDIQSATLVLRSEHPELVDASIIINYPQTGQPNQARGRFQWSPARGFESTGGTAYGQQYVNLLPINAAFPDRGSERRVDAANQTLTFVFRWTLNAAYRTLATNKIAYHFGESSSGHAVGWAIPNPTLNDFTVSTSAPLARLEGLLIAQGDIVANGNSTQIIQLVFSTPTPEMIDSASIIINKPTVTANQARGYFQWSPARGFESVGGAAYGAQHVNLITTGLNASVRVVDPIAQTVTFKFFYTLNPSYGNIATNGISYSFGESTLHHTVAWTPIVSNFSVTTPVVLSTLQTLTTTPVVHANGVEIQAAELRLRMDEPSAIDVASIIVNKPAGTVNQARGYFQWSPARGFESTGGRAYGAQHVTLLAPNPTNTNEGSEYRDNHDGTVSVIFRWRIKPSSGALAQNTISYYFAQSRYNYRVGWRVWPTGFAVVLP